MATVKPAVKLTGREGVLAAIPTLLGFHPQDSLCVICLRGGLIGPIMRIDLAGLGISTLNQIVELDRHAEQVILVVYAGPRTKYDVGPTARILAERVPVVDVIEVGNDPQPSDPDLDAAQALNGRGTLTGRDQVVASVAHRGRDAEALPPLLWGNVAERDAMLARFMRDAQEALPGLIFALTHSPDDDPQLPDLAAAAALVAYRTGDGALVQVCVHRGLVAEPGHRATPNEAAPGRGQDLGPPGVAASRVTSTSWTRRRMAHRCWRFPPASPMC